jgi:hypothetical protein
MHQLQRARDCARGRCALGLRRVRRTRLGRRHRLTSRSADLPRQEGRGEGRSGARAQQGERGRQTMEDVSAGFWGVLERRVGMT